MDADDDWDFGSASEWGIFDSDGFFSQIETMLTEDDDDDDDMLWDSDPMDELALDIGLSDSLASVDTTESDIAVSFDGEDYVLDSTSCNCMVTPRLS